MGQPVTVVEKPSSRPGIVRFELNRILTGMGHDRYLSREDAFEDRPSAVLARRLFDRGSISSVHVNSNIVTVEITTGASDGIREIIEDLYTYYTEGVEPPSDEELLAGMEEA
jgi:hypothetical protein